MTDRLRLVVKTLEDLKLTDLRIYDFRGFSPYFDFQVVATASNERQVHASINHLREAMPDERIKRVEGADTSRWLLFDLGDIIVHVMHKDEREYYQFEKLFVGREISLSEDL
ncbi:MAG TPA: ribosome silencing factor [Bacillota bacterium]|nr:ribosome silencing factor [Bacillota bacterium]HPF42794.1 ribosome silencing factor [Bacillota bacterium]HPJ85504.1 ribosome silencing factor [Bacillota bacterium]HPQ62359.1 ribosome silencing factor [Bacillota bacterium]